MPFGHLARMDESADVSRILTSVSQSDWKRRQDLLAPPGWPQLRTTSVWKMPPNGTGQATLEVIGSKRSCAPKCAS